MADAGKITIGQIADAIVATLGAASSIRRTQSYDELSEGMPPGDLPLLQVYWQDWTMEVPGDTDRTTFVGGMRTHELTFHADLYAAQLGNIDENFEQMHDTVEELIQIFEEQDVKPYFGLDGIQAWSVTADRATFPYEGTEHTYVGARFFITVTVF